MRHVLILCFLLQCLEEEDVQASSKRPTGRPMQVNHLHDDVGPTHFSKMIMSASLEYLPIPNGFCGFICTIPRTITLKTNTGCSWKVKLKEIDGRISLDQGWAGFAIAHQIKIGYLLTFKVLKGDVYRVTIFDFSMSKSSRSAANTI